MLIFADGIMRHYVNADYKGVARTNANHLSKRHDTVAVTKLDGTPIYTLYGNIILHHGTEK